MNHLEGGHMFPCATPRTRLPLLAVPLVVLLVALSLFAPSASFAFAHTTSDAVANARPGITPSGPAAHEERATCHDAGRPGHPHGPARVRDRHRTTAAPQPDTAPGRPLPHRHTPAAGEPLAPGAAVHHRSRPTTDHSPAALQVFRC
ncbi:hypothetical protein ACGV4K_07515 [Streptomyces sp. WAC8370]|uniref:Secreted protein n=1 Tax=Streptomyces ardesiacus TaxID=285564 RepID=A0ABW8HDN4_9ACTN|nr:hypothetical protein [Streptomyces sp. CoH17]